MQQFPKECSDGSVKIDGNKIICEDNYRRHSCAVNIDDIQYAYVVVDVNKQSFLFLFDHHQHFIPTIFKGFKNVYEELSEKFSFNDAIFFEHVNGSMALKKEIWRRHYEPTYEIWEGDFNDYDAGFEIQSPKKQFVSWETTYDQLAAFQAVVFEESPYGQKIAKFNYPIRIGHIVLNDFRAYFDNARTDVPVLHFYTHCFDFNGTDKSYEDLKTILFNAVSVNSTANSYERADQRKMNFNLNGMDLSICYTYDSDWQFNCGYTSLAIENKRVYANLLIDEDYESKIKISDYLLLAGNIGIPEDYKRNSRVRRRPQGVTEKFGEQPVIWIDDVNAKIGFSSRNFSQVFDVNDVKSFGIQNMIPARGSGGSYLEIVLESEKYNYAIFSERCYFFDQYAERIKKLTNKELTVRQEQRDY